MQTAWERLVEKYAKGRRICNCRQAYFVFKDGAYTCQYGCATNQLVAKETIAVEILKEKG